MSRAWKIAKAARKRFGAPVMSFMRLALVQAWSEFKAARKVWLGVEPVSDTTAVTGGLALDTYPLEPFMPNRVSPNGWYSVTRVWAATLGAAKVWLANVARKVGAALTRC